MHLPSRKTIRVAGHDYGTVGYYFVTICIAERRESLGHMDRDQVVLSSIGIAAETELRWLPVRFDHVELDVFQVMPDHLHAIVGLREASPVQMNFRQFSSPQPRSLSMVVNHFKGAVTRYARHYADPTFAWQSRFHERFVRNEREMDALRQYIVMNPKRRYFDHLDRIRRDMPPGMSEGTTP